MRKYIFPGGTLPTLAEIIKLGYDGDFHLLDVESLRRHYYKTLMCWYHNFQAVKDKVAAQRGETFVRMWDLYLCGCAAAFTSVISKSISYSLQRMSITVCL